MNICKGITYELKELNNLFIEMTSKNCNQRCSKCYIDFPMKKNIKDFISIDIVKKTLSDSVNENLHCIYFTGAEPMTHPDFNTILRLSLKRCNVCICTNGSFLNEKKIRFLKKVEEEGLGINESIVKNTNTIDSDYKTYNDKYNQIFFKLSVAHYDEKMSDEKKYRGNFRQNILALKILSKYNFTSVLSVENHYNLTENEIFDNFNKIFIENDISNTDIQINKIYPCDLETENLNVSKTDCINGRVVTKNGVYACPFLANDYRGRMGASLKDFSKIVNADTNYCILCSENKKPIFGIG